jgi:hypothetical protein
MEKVMFGMKSVIKIGIMAVPLGTAKVKEMIMTRGACYADSNSKVRLG